MNAIVCNPSAEASISTFTSLKGKKIIFVIDEMASITAGGTERQLLQLVELASTAGLSPEILVLRKTEWLTPEVAGCPVHHRNVTKLFDPRGIKELMKIAGWMRSQRFDILQSFFADANVIGPLLGKAAGVPYILTSRRNLNYSMTPGRLVAQRFANRLTTGIVANCEAVRKAVTLSEKPDPEKIHVVYNGIDLRSFTPCPATHSQIRNELGVTQEEVLIGCVSAVRSIKGVNHLVGAAQQVLPKNSLAKFCVVGDGEDLPNLRKITDSDEQLSKRFVWVGAREDVKPYLRAFDIAVLPSLSEGFSNSILEYMAIGLPVVATDVGGNREALEDGAGMLVPPGDEPALAQALEHLLGSPTERMNMSFRAAERVRKWDLEIALHENASYYARLLTEQAH